ncbi:EF-P 5-aminopentanol modification-associated protein YfmH [Caldinitratiruptor microaerophilus]|uniref:Peptidase M16 n=1 Tax=Caldinitratiruptor microaerophilus TaxID=671077 RepID=A0AA35CMV0_9FIRM|nr:pitrilysin family protein [Caldinitratiruptor microaerophilus]BDG62047.1 peptidase M16 [Caldinitratiruptor microaerophilus]
MEVHHDERLRETIYWETLPSGLRVGVLPRKGWRETTGRVAVNYGSNDSRWIPPGETEPVEVPAGIAHFLEHKLFESEEGNAFDRFAALGADANAYTSNQQTVYYFSTTDRVPECLETLLDMVQTPYFTDQTVEKEQGIIEQEIRMYLDHPEWRSRQNLLEALYQKHPVRIDIAGTVESIRQITKEQLYRCHATFYHPSNMMVFVAGDVDPQAVIQQVADNVEKRGYRPQPPVQRLYEPEPAEVAERRREQELAVSQPIFRLGFKDRRVGETGRDLLRKELLTSVVLDGIIGKATPLYNELYEAGLIDGRFGFDYTGEPTYGYTTFAGPTRDPEALEARLLEGIEKARRQGLESYDFERAKRKALGRFLSMLNSTEMIAYVVNDGFFKNIGLFDVLPVAESLTLDEANERLREHFDPQYAVTSIIWPHKGAQSKAAAAN